MGRETLLRGRSALRQIAADGWRELRFHFLPGEHGLTREPEVTACGLRAHGSEAHGAVIDAAAVEEPVIRGEDGGLGDYGGAGESRKVLLWIKEAGEGESVLFLIAFDLRRGLRGVDAEEGDAAR